MRKGTYILPEALCAFYARATRAEQPRLRAEVEEEAKATKGNKNSKRRYLLFYYLLMAWRKNLLAEVFDSSNQFFVDPYSKGS